MDVINIKKIQVSYSPSVIGYKFIHDLLMAAKNDKKGSSVAKHLIGASMQLTFPHINILNKNRTSDDNNLYDYFIGDTAFHVTISPMFGVYEKCKRNIENGFRVYLIVPEGRIAAARENAEEVAPGKITVQSIESFVSQNIEELSNFSKERLAHGFYRLLKTYNERVDDVEVDKSMLIEIPRNLAQYADQ